MKKQGLLIAIIILLIPVHAVGGECVNWPRIMVPGTLVPGTTKEGKIVVVESFTDYTKLAGDDWLSAGLRDLLASMLSTSDGLRVFSGLSAVYNSDAKNPAFVIAGMFQHIGGNLRVFVKVSRGDDRSLVSQYEIITPYPENRELFLRLADTTKQIWNIMQVKGDNSRLGAVRDATHSTRAYESYAKGRQALETYKINEMEVAKTWFEQTKRVDYRSPFGYQGMADLFIFLGLYHKQRREPFGMYFEQAEKELSDMNRLAKRPPPVFLPTKKPTKKEDKGSKLENRFLLGHAAFNEGLFAVQEGAWQQALKAFKKAVGFVPEDAVAWYQLARIYENLGNTAESSKALQKAYEVNPCIEK